MGRTQRVTVKLNNDYKTAEVTIDGNTKTLQIYAYADCVRVFGVAVKYRTGEKVWNGEFIFWPTSGNVNNVSSGLDHRGSRHQLEIVGFYSDFAAGVQSQHNAQK